MQVSSVSSAASQTAQAPQAVKKDMSNFTPSLDQALKAKTAERNVASTILSTDAQVGGEINIYA